MSMHSASMSVDGILPEDMVQQWPGKGNETKVNPPQADPRMVVEHLLPTCQRCKRLRKKCDSQLPNCRVCQKAKVDCIILDGSRGQPLERRYVHSLLQRLEKLKTLRKAAQVGLQDVAQHEVPFLTPPQSIEGLSARASVHSVFLSGKATSFDFLFDAKSSGIHSSQLLGASSGLSVAVNTISIAHQKGMFRLDDDDKASWQHYSSEQPRSMVPIDAITEDEARSLVEMYILYIDDVYPILPPETIREDMELYLRTNRPFKRDTVETLNQPQKVVHAVFRTCMICAITCAAKSQREPLYKMYSAMYFAEAGALIDRVASEVSPAALSATLLLSLYCILVPEHGDTWRLLAFACRLSTELGFHQPYLLPGEDESQRQRRRRIFQGLRVIENYVSQLRGRRSALDQMPYTRLTETSPTLRSENGQAKVDTSGSSPRKEIMQLRSQIYREMYMPGSFPEVDIEWYRERYLQLQAYQPGSEASSTQSIAFTISYHATVCFLFQPLVLQALTKLQDQMGQDQFFSADIDAFFNTGDPGVFDSNGSAASTFLPLECYESACELIEIYNNVLLQPSEDHWGYYPLSTISVHALYVAGMLIMALCMLISDGRAGSLQRVLQSATELDSGTVSLDGVGQGSDTSNMMALENLWSPPRRTGLLSDLCKQTTSCLILLTRCVDRFSSMVGMLHTYRKLYEQVIPDMVRKGYA